MIEKSYYKNSSAHRSLSEESIRLLEWDNLKTQLASFASTKMGENAILEFDIPCVIMKFPEDYCKKLSK